MTSFPLLTTNSNSPILLAWYSLDGTVWNREVENNHPFLQVDLHGHSQRVFSESMYSPRTLRAQQRVLPCLQGV